MKENRKSIITIIGSGVMGSAMSFPASDNGHTIRLVGTMLDREIIRHASNTGWHPTLKRQLPEGLSYYQLEALEEAIAGADIIIGGVNSFGIEWFANEIIPQLPPHLPVLSVTKGMMNQPDGTLLSYPRYYAIKAQEKTLSKGFSPVSAPQHDTGKRFYAVGGPCTSYELADRDYTHVCFCGHDVDTLRMLKNTLETSYYHISQTTDVEGLECAVALKNAYALAVTLAVGLANKRDGRIHYNSQAALFGQSIREMQKLLDLFGYGSDNIIYGASDLYVTIFGGRTRHIGTLLGEGLPIGEALKTLEGVTLESLVIATRTAQAVRTLIAKNRPVPSPHKLTLSEKDFPLLMHVDELINLGSKVNIPWESFTTA